MPTKKAERSLEQSDSSSKSTTQWMVYLLVDVFGEIRYVGCTSNPIMRAYNHRRKHEGLYTFEPLVSFRTRSEGLREEKNWIRRLANAGCRLMNEVGYRVQGVSRQRLWQREQVRNGNCMRCGLKRRKYKSYCDRCRKQATRREMRRRKAQ